MLALCLAAACAAWLMAGRAEDQARRLALEAAQPPGGGFGLFRLYLEDASSPRRHRWERLGAGPLAFPAGPLPGREHYRLTALARLDLDRPTRLTVRLAADDGVRLVVDGRTALDDWGIHPMRPALVSLDLGPGPHLMEVAYFQAGGGASLEAAFSPPEASRGLRPLSPGFDGKRWEGLVLEGEHWRLAACLALGAALLLLAAPALLRVLPWAAPRAAALCALPGLAAGVRLGAALVLASQGAYYLGHHDEHYLARLIVAPLAGAVLGAAMGVLAAGWAARRPAFGRRALTLARAAEPWLWPLAVSAALALFTLNTLSENGASLAGFFLNATGDAAHYRDLAKNGYALHRLDSGALLGNVFWHPLFSWLVRGFIWLGLDKWWAAVAAAWLGAYAALATVGRLARELEGPAAGRWAPVLLAAWPCGWYLLLPYPYGLAVALSAGAVLALLKDRPGLAGLLGAGAALAYPTGVLVALAPAARALRRLWREPDPRPALRELILAGGGPAAGLAALCLHHWLRFGDFWLPITGHALWGLEPAWPWEALWKGIFASPPHLSNAITMLLAISLVVVFARRLPAELWALLLGILLVGPLTGSIDSNYRQLVMLWPLWVMAAGSPRSPWLKAVVVWLGLALAAYWYIPQRLVDGLT